MKRGMRELWANKHKTVELIFQILIFKMLVNFSWTAAAKQSRPTGLLLVCLKVYCQFTVRLLRCSDTSFLCVIIRVKTLAAHRRARLNEAQTLHQFFRDIDDEEAWIKYLILLTVQQHFVKHELNICHSLPEFDDLCIYELYIWMLHCLLYELRVCIGKRNYLLALMTMVATWLEYRIFARNINV